MFSDRDLYESTPETRQEAINEKLAAKWGDLRVAVESLVRSLGAPAVAAALRKRADKLDALAASPTTGGAEDWKGQPFAPDPVLYDSEPGPKSPVIIDRTMVISDACANCEGAGCNNCDNRDPHAREP